VSQTTTGPVPAGAKQCVAPEAVVNPTVETGFDPGPGPVPGNGQNSATLPFKKLFLAWLEKEPQSYMVQRGLQVAAEKRVPVEAGIFPLSSPFFAFTQSWNEFLYANVFVNSVEVRTITTGLSLFVVEDVFFWGPMMGASFLSTLPPLIMYLIFQRWVVKGLTLGAVKG
jgi:hypothetical protein